MGFGGEINSGESHQEKKEERFEEEEGGMKKRSKIKGVNFYIFIYICIYNYIINI